MCVGASRHREAPDAEAEVLEPSITGLSPSFEHGSSTRSPLPRRDRHASLAKAAASAQLMAEKRCDVKRRKEMPKFRTPRQSCQWQQFPAVEGVSRQLQHWQRLGDGCQWETLPVPGDPRFRESRWRPQLFKSVHALELLDEGEDDLAATAPPGFSHGFGSFGMQQSHDPSFLWPTSRSQSAPKCSLSNAEPAWISRPQTSSGRRLPPLPTAGTPEAKTLPGEEVSTTVDEVGGNPQLAASRSPTRSTSCDSTGNLSQRQSGKVDCQQARHRRWCLSLPATGEKLAACCRALIVSRLEQ